MDNFVTITDVVLRDGLQDEPWITSPQDRMRIAEALVGSGVRDIEAVSFVNPRRVPQMAHAEEVAEDVLRIPGVTWRALALNARGIERAAAAGITQISLVVSASSAHSEANSGKSPSQAIAEMSSVIEAHPNVTFSGGVATAFVCPFEGKVPASSVLSIVEAYASVGVERIGLADTIGTASPQAVQSTLDELRREHSGLALSLHLHNAHGQAFDTVDRALDVGVVEFDAASGGYGGCPFAPGAHGNIATEDLVAHLHKRGYETGIDLDKLGHVPNLIKQALYRGAPVPA